MKKLLAAFYRRAVLRAVRALRSALEPRAGFRQPFASPAATAGRAGGTAYLGALSTGTSGTNALDNWPSRWSPRTGRRVIYVSTSLMVCPATPALSLRRFGPRVPVVPGPLVLHAWRAADLRRGPSTAQVQQLCSSIGEVLLRGRLRTG